MQRGGRASHGTESAGGSLFRQEVPFPLPLSDHAPGTDGHAGQHRDLDTQSVRGRRRNNAIPRAPQRYRFGGSATKLQGQQQSNGSFGIRREQPYEQVELQIEVLTPFVGHLMLYMWYAVLIIAVVVQAIDFLEWDVVNICGGRSVDMRNYDEWTSSCATAVQDGNALYNVTWKGGPYDVNFERVLVRFTRVVISLRTPDNWASKGVDGSQDYSIQVQLPHVYKLDEGERFAQLPIRVTCEAHSQRCDHVDLDMGTVLKFTTDGHASIVLNSVPPEIARRANESSIGILYQKPSYVLGTIIWRYVFILLSFFHLMRFVAYKEFTSTLYEQVWAMGLQIALIWYLDPMFALNIISRPESNVLMFIEQHFPSWFVAVTIGFMLSVVTASMPWIAAEVEQQNAKCSRFSLQRLRSYLCESRSIFDPPAWSKFAVFLFILIVVLLDISEVLYSTNDSAVNAWRNPLYYIVIGLICFSTIVCCALIIYLHCNLGKKSYLDSRPQQLACRVFILVLIMAIIYFTYHFSLFFLWYLPIPGMMVLQPMAQLPAIMVSTFLVNIMTLVYTTRRRNDLVPIHPRNEMWKQVVWPDRWYHWLSRHGSSMYIFRSELEETYFNQNQYLYRMRQFLAKNKRMLSLQRSGHGRVPGGNASDTTRNAAQDEDLNVASVFSRTVNVSPPLIPFCSFIQPQPFAQMSSRFADMNESFLLSPVVRDLAGTVCGAFVPLPPTPLPSTYENNDIPLRRDGMMNTDLESTGTHSLPRVATPGTPFNQAASSNHLQDEETMMTRDADMLSTESSASENYEQWRILARAFSRARSVLGSAIRNAERRFIHRPLYALEIAEAAILDSAIRRFGGKEYLPFFNLETAIDCFNHSWEAYGKAERLEISVEAEVPGVGTSGTNGMPRRTGNSTVKEDAEVTGPSAELNGRSTTVPTEGDGREPAMEPTGESVGNTVPVDLDVSPPINVERLGYELLLVVKRKDVQVIITKMNVEHKNHKGKFPRIVVAFRGTVSMTNAWHNARARRVVWEEMQENAESTFLPSRFCCSRKPTVHKGFLDVWNAHREHVLETVWKELSADKSTVYRVFATGHSLGGALATLCAYSLRKMLLEKDYSLPGVTVYTFGQPPLGNKAFRSIYDRAIPQHFRLVNESDTVALIRMYGCHIGVEVDVDRHGNYICQPTSIERMFRPTKGRGFSVENHLMMHYANSLNAIGQMVECPVTASKGEALEENPTTTMDSPHQPQKSQDSREPCERV